MREITQLQYSNWPDFGAPAHPTHLLGLVEQCDAVVRATNNTSSSSLPEGPDARPIVVHCSAGCGRTGTFCTVDSVIDMLKSQKRGGHSQQHSSPVQRNTRQPTPMDIDPSSQTVSFNFTTPAPPSAASLFQQPLSNDKTWLTDDSIDLIEKTVQDFRRQRLSMVQSLRQYVLCYESVLEWLCEQTPRSA
jgi:protein tyrosine phosphatase